MLGISFIGGDDLNASKEAMTWRDAFFSNPPVI